jgi:hypothetical protein
LVQDEKDLQLIAEAPEAAQEAFSNTVSADLDVCARGIALVDVLTYDIRACPSNIPQRRNAPRFL